MKKVILILGAFFILAGCGLEQDPFSGKNKKFTDTHPATDHTEKPKPIASDALRIDTESIMKFKEGTATAYEIRLRNFAEGFSKTEFIIVNPQDFPGLKYDKDTGILTWQPEAGFVQDDFFAERTLSLRLEAISDDEKLPSLFVERKVQVTVGRTTYQAPEFSKSLTDLTSVEEGSRNQYCALFEDKDSFDQDGKRPQIQLMQSTGEVNLMPFVALQSLENNTANMWKMCLDIDLRNIDLTNSLSKSTISFRFISRFNVASPKYNVNLNVYNAMAVPTTTWETQTLLNPNEKTSLSFFVMDPKFEGRISISKQEIPVGSTLNCKNKNYNLMVCEFTWTPPFEMEGKNQTIKLTIRNQNAVVPSKFREQRIDLYFKVAKLPGIPKKLPKFPKMPVPGFPEGSF